MAAANRPVYVTTADRAGAALAAGGALAGMLVALLIGVTGQHAAWALVGGWLIGSLFATLAIVAVAGPPWVVLHAAGRRGPVAAAATGAVCALAILSAARVLTTVHPLLATPAAGVAIFAAAGGIGWAMQRVAYRRG